ncbi:MAG: hypothetical protein KAW89_00535 [Armatimonadetes bacterium]|nr:hypothetical protein [Armatimonadota bacterium]
MRRDSFPTFQRIGRWFLKTLKIPAVQKTCFPVGGYFVMVQGLILIDSLVHPRYMLDPWYLYLYSFSGFTGGLLGAWGLKHGWGGPLYGAILGLYFGGWLFYAHAIVAFIGGPDGCYDALIGDRIAGLLFFVLATVGGCMGTRLAGVPMPFLRGPLTCKRILLWLLAIGLIVAFWLALYYKWQLEFYRGGP